jgi:hypothetical protein
LILNLIVLPADNAVVNALDIVTDIVDVVEPAHVNAYDMFYIIIK